MAKRRNPGGSGRLGQSSTSDVVVVRFDGQALIGSINRVQGRFMSGQGDFQHALKEANITAAEKVQEGMVKRLNNEVGEREQRPGQRLEKSILDVENREVYANTFSVGIGHWMDRSPAKRYWRQIEMGNVERLVYALFTNNGVGSEAYGPPFSLPGENVNEMRMPQFKGSAAIGGARKGGKRPKQILAGPYPAYHYSWGGQDAFDALNMFELYSRALAPLGITLTKK